MQKEEWSDSDNIELRICTSLICNHPSCGDVFSYYAEGSVYEEYGSNGGTDYNITFKTKSIYPSPHIINLPELLYENVKSNLVSSFNCLWFDTDLAANAVRNSLEALLTDLGYPAYIEDKWVPLAIRIKRLAKEKSDDAVFFKSMQNLLNDGSHGADVPLNSLLDAYEAYEIYLEKMFDTKNKRFVELKDKLANYKNTSARD